MNYYERHLGDYAKDTAHLTMLEHGAYNLLLDRYYGTESGIPESQAHRVARARTKEEKQAVDDVLAEFFSLVDGMWINKRADEEITKAQVKISAAKENGKKGGRPRRVKSGSENETQQKPSGLSVGSENETQQKPSGLSVGSENETQQKAHQTPDTRHQVNPEAIASGVNSTGVAHEPEGRRALDTDSQSPTARVCLGLKAMGYGDTNPHDPKLTALFDAGLSPEEILAAGNDGKGKGKGFRWVLATAEGRRRDAASVKPLPTKPSAGQKTAEAAARWLESQGVQTK